MPHSRSLALHSTSTLSGLLLAAALMFASCTTSQIPQGAIDALAVRWQSLPGSTTHNLAVVHAWPGKPGSKDAVELPASMEVWCVDTEISPKSDPSTTPESMLWIVTRPNKGADWEASPLMVLSSIWPYEACLGKSP